MSALLYPAIDLRGGQVVRLQQGNYSDETVYGSDPVAVARDFAQQGARWIHIVDLDGARSGDGINRSVIGAIAAAVGDTTSVQAGGGVRSMADAQELADLGIARVVLGSAAVADPSFVVQASNVVAVAVGLDHRNGEVAEHGWTKGSGVQLHIALQWFPTAAAFVITDISRDGMLQGPDLEGLRTAASVASAPVVASGGIASLDDVRLCGLIPNICGVITGKAVYEGRFTVAQGIEVLSR